ncbi:MAG: tetratricopeptide repeat protein, partial [Deltaproteobacteria bacterium]|nr:tetratricopeptide repeat protein [Deltaproteobacteria bacterium]
MATKKKPRTRKQLLKEPDEFMTFAGKAISFVTGHQKQISYTLCAMVAIVLIFFGYRFFAQRAETKTFSILAQTQSKYETLKKTSSAAEAYSQVSEAFQSIIKKYGGNAGGKLARVIYANISYDARQYEKAIALYKQSLNDFKDDKLVYNLILSSLGYAYQQVEDEQNATAYFEKAASATDSPIREEALFNLGLLYEKLGEA